MTRPDRIALIRAAHRRVTGVIDPVEYELQRAEREAATFYRIAAREYEKEIREQEEL